MSEIRLTELNARWRSQQQQDGTVIRDVLVFTCPRCGNHSIGVPTSTDGRPGTWQRNGKNIEVLTLSPSVDCTQTPIIACQNESVNDATTRCLFHGFVQEGFARG